VRRRARATLAFRDAAGVVDLARLISPGHQAEIGADVSGSANARGSSAKKASAVNCPTPRDGHQPPACRGGSCRASHVSVDLGDRSHHSGSCGTQYSHGGGASGTSCWMGRFSIRSRKPGSWSKAGGAITTPNARTRHWAASRQRLKCSFPRSPRGRLRNPRPAAPPALADSSTLN
jgi:hypothetical protein